MPSSPPPFPPDFSAPGPAADAVRTTAALAARLGLSRWAVSRALNARPGVSAATVRRVRAALGEMGFEPDPLARSLRGGRTGLVGVALPGFSRVAGTAGSAEALVDRLVARLQAHGLRPVLELTGGEPPREEAALGRFAAWRAEALVLLGWRGTSAAPALTRLLGRGLPVVAVGARADLPAGAVPGGVDEEQSMQLAVSHLQESGRARLGFLGFDEDSPRLRAAQRACQARGISWRHQVRVVADLAPPAGATLAVSLDPFARGWALADDWLRRRHPAEALLLSDDEAACGTLRRLREAGRRVPDDVAVLGFGNLPLAEFCEPSLTSVDPGWDQLADRVADLVAAQLRAPGQLRAAPLVTGPVLVRRASTGAPRQPPG